MAFPSETLDPELEEVHIITLHGDVEPLERLLFTKSGLAMNEKTAQGETPLMLAALMGHTEIASLLLQRGSNRTVKNNFGCDALAYTTMSGRNIARRAFFKERGFLEKYGAQYNRDIIAALLTSKFRPPHRLLYNSGRPTGPMYLRKTSKGAEAFLRVGSMNIPDSSKIDLKIKTAGWIHVESNLIPEAWTYSGYSDCPPDDKTPSPPLNPRKWTKIARVQFGAAMKFKFKRHECDRTFKNGPSEEWEKGRYYASHVEVKLAVWYCSRLLRALNLKWDPQDPDSLTRCLLALNQSEIGDAKSAVMELSEEPCKQCSKFVIELQRLTGIKFTMKKTPALAVVPFPVETPRVDPLASEMEDEEEKEPHLDESFFDDIDVEPELPEDCDTETVLYDPTENHDFAIFRRHQTRRTNPSSPEATGLDHSSDAEDYADDDGDKNYRGQSKHTRPRLRQCDGDDDEDSIMEGADNNDLADSKLKSVTRASSATLPDVASPKSSGELPSQLGNIDNPIEIESSPFEELIGRKRKVQTLDDYSHLKEGQTKKLKVKVEETEPQTADASLRKSAVNRNFVRHQEMPSLHPAGMLPSEDIENSEFSSSFQNIVRANPSAIKLAIDRIRAFARS